MLKLGTETASLTNHMMSGNSQPTPELGMGATICMWTDRHAGTIIKITPKQIHVQEDKAIRTDSTGVGDSQSYRYEPDPNGQIHIFRSTKRGWRDDGGSGLAIGVRESYHDFSF